MSKAVQTALQSHLQTLDAFTAHPDGVAVGDYRALDSGLSEVIVITPGAFDSGDNTDFERTRTWDVPLELFVKYMDSTSAFAALNTLRDAVLALLDGLAVMDDAGLITFRRVRAPDDPQEVYDRAGGGPYFLTQELRAEIVEVVRD
jgi:hypothetical protein